MELTNRLFSAFASRSHPGSVIRPESETSAARLQKALERKTAAEISVDDINRLFEGNLWLFTPAAFLHYLPAFMNIVLTRYSSVSVFASELIGSLTKPAREDVEASLDRLAQLPPGLPVSDPLVTDALRQQQLAWFDSGTPTSLFEQRYRDLTEEEGAAVLAFLEAFGDDHGADFPFGEVETAINRHWARYR